MYFLIYQTTNKINGKIYIGQHQTNNLNDGYLGSGKILWNAINKYGIENFDRKILFFCKDKDEMDAKEKEIVNEEFVARDDTYNLKVGGDGGWDYINKNRDSINDGNFGFIYINKMKLNNIGKIGKKLSEYHKKRVKEGIAKAKLNNPEKFSRVGNKNPMFGKNHSEETRKKMSKNHFKNKNAMYGKIWIYNIKTLESKTIFKTESIPNGWKAGRKIKNGK